MNIPVFKNNITLHAVFGNIKRPKHVLIVLQDKEGNYLLGAKPKFYPEGIFRFVGGGMDEGESPLESAVREIQEELQITVTPSELKALAEIVTTGTCEGTTYTNTTYLFGLIVDESQLTASDDIEYIKKMTLQEMEDLIQRYKDLSDDNWYSGPDDYDHNWKDYGEMYSFIHQVGLDLTKSNLNQ